MTLDAAQIAALLEGTTPGPWAYDQVTLTSAWGPSGEHVHYTSGRSEYAAANARLIAAAPDLARTALDAIAAREAAERERDALREALQPFAELSIARAANAPEWRPHDAVQVVVRIDELRAAFDAVAPTLKETPK